MKKTRQTLLKAVLVLFLAVFITKAASIQAQGSSLLMSTPASVELGTNLKLELRLETPVDLKSFSVIISYDENIIQFAYLDSSFARVVSNQNGELHLTSDSDLIGQGEHDFANVTFQTITTGLSSFSVLSTSAYTQEDIPIGIDASQTLLTSITEASPAIPTVPPTSEPPPTPLPSTTATSPSITTETTRPIETTVESTVAVTEEATTTIETTEPIDETSDSTTAETEESSTESSEIETSSSDNTSESSIESTDTEISETETDEGASLSRVINIFKWIIITLVALAALALIALIILNRMNRNAKRK